MSTQPGEPVFLPYQTRWCGDPAKVKIIEKSRRVGISWAAAGYHALQAASQNGMDQWYMGYNESMAQEFVLDAAAWTRAFGAAASKVNEEIYQDDEKNSILSYVIRYASGYRVTALSSRPSNLRSKQGNVIVDEAAFHEDLSQVTKAAMAMLMWGGTVSYISTHNGVDNPFNTLIEECRKGKFKYSVHRVTLDDALRDGLFKRICYVQGLEWSPELQHEWRTEVVESYGDHADEELHCIPSKSGGVYIPRELAEDRARAGVPVLRWELPDGFARLPAAERSKRCRYWMETHLYPVLHTLNQKLPHHVGMDFGRVADLSVIPVLETGQRMHRTTKLMVELRRVPYDQQREILWKVIDGAPKFCGAAIDATGNGEYLAETTWQRYGERLIERIKLNDKWYAEQLPPFKAAFEDADITIPKDLDVIQDIVALRVIDGIPKLPKAKLKGKDGKPRHGDAAIGLLLAHYASRAINENFGYKAVKTSDKKHRRPVRTTMGLKRRGGML